MNTTTTAPAFHKKDRFVEPTDVHQYSGMIGAFAHQDAEDSVLAMMLQDKKVAIKASEGWIETDDGRVQIDEDFFSTVQKRLLFAAMTDIAPQNGLYYGKVDISIRARNIAKERKIKELPSFDLINKLSGFQGTNGLQASLGALGRMREMRSVFTGALFIIQNMTPDCTEDEVKAITERWNQTRLAGRSEERIMLGKDSMARLRKDLKERITRKRSGLYNPLDYPWGTWNHWADPMSPGKLHMLIMANGDGKTTYTRQYAEYLAQRKFKVALVLVEDPSISIQLKQASTWSGVSLRKIKAGDVTPEEELLLDKACDEMEKFAQYINWIDASGQTAGGALRSLNLLKESQGIDGVLVDYMQAFQTSGSGDWREGGTAAKLLASWSTQQKTPIFITDQVGKAGEKSREEGNRIKNTDGFGWAENSWVCQVRFTAMREIAKDAPLYDNGGVKLCEAGERSPMINCLCSKNNDGKTGAFTQWLDDKNGYRIVDARPPQYLRTENYRPTPTR